MSLKETLLRELSMSEADYQALVNEERENITNPTFDYDNMTLEDAVETKLAELDKRCNIAILNGFDYDINGVSCHFSCSTEAQANFTGTDALFKDGTITTVNWTVLNNETGKVERVTLDQSTFNGVRLEVFNHINSQIAKFRDTLQPQVESATTVDEVKAVVWE